MDVQVRFLPSGTTLRVAPGTSLHEAIRRAGLPIASGCGADGICGRCAVAIRSDRGRLSEETREEAQTKRGNRIDPGDRLACRTRVEQGEIAVTASYW